MKKILLIIAVLFIAFKKKPAQIIWHNDEEEWLFDDPITESSKPTIIDQIVKDNSVSKTIKKPKNNLGAELYERTYDKPKPKPKPIEKDNFRPKLGNPSKRDNYDNFHIRPNPVKSLESQIVSELDLDPIVISKPVRLPKKHKYKKTIGNPKNSSKRGYKRDFNPRHF